MNERDLIGLIVFSLVTIGTIFLYIITSAPRRKEFDFTAKDIATSINANEYHSDGEKIEVSFMGTRNGVRYKTIFRSATRSVRSASYTPSQLSHYIYFNLNGPKFNLYVSKKNDLLTQGILTLLILQKLIQE